MPFLCVHTLALLTFISNHSQRLSLWGCHDYIALGLPFSHLQTSGSGGRHQVTFQEVSAKVLFHLIGAIVLYAHCGQTCNALIEEGVFQQKVGAVGRGKENEC